MISVFVVALETSAACTPLKVLDRRARTAIEATPWPNVLTAAMLTAREGLCILLVVSSIRVLRTSEQLLLVYLLLLLLSIGVNVRVPAALLYLVFVCCALFVSVKSGG